MSENITESRLTEAELEYEIKYNEALKFFENKRYSIEQFDVINNPVRYIRILSVEKTVEANPALAAREQMQKALMALSAMDMRFNMIIRHCGSTTEVYVGTVCYGKNSAALFPCGIFFLALFRVLSTTRIRNPAGRAHTSLTFS